MNWPEAIVTVFAIFAVTLIVTAAIKVWGERR